jgi:UDP-N-acetylmuramate--alanine ligase
MTTEDIVDLTRPRRIHIVGLGGAGMSAIAEVLVGTGHRLSGSDLSSSAPLERLAAQGVETHVGHRPEQIGDAELLAISTAIPDTNPEVVAARQRGIPVLRRAQILTAITKAWRTIAVAGTHGKTTTSAMLTTALRGAGLDPAFIVGGDLVDLDRGAAVGSGDVLVVEADESDGTFIELAADGVVVTNVEPDHLEHYGGFEPLQRAFVQFVDQAAGPRVVCIDDPGARALLADRPGVMTYGLDPDADWRIIEPLPTPMGIRFTVENDGRRYDVALRQPGLHNARNAAAALAMCVELGGDGQAGADALTSFGGVGRRFEQRGTADGVTLVDDYAHLPTEVEAALEAAASTAPDRLVAVFQPHRYSRTEQLWSTFTDAFGDADLLIVTGIYSSGEAPRPGILGSLISDDIAAAHPDADIRYVESLEDVVEVLSDELRPGDLCLTLGAGDLTTVPDRVLERLRERT